MSFLYFAYGSNMLTRRMLINCPSAKYVCKAELKKYKLLFSGYANSWKGAVATIIESENDSVWGIVWQISKEHEEALNKQEIDYQPITVSVCTTDNTNIVCKTYKKSLACSDYSKPSVVYKTVMIQGAKEHNMNLSYIQRLESYQDNGYKGEVDIPVSIKL